VVEKALSELVVASDHESIEQLLMTFDDPDDAVKRAGVAAILQIVPQGDSKVVTAIPTCHDASCCFTHCREHAFLTAGSQVLSMILTTKFRHEDRKVRAVATEALQGLSIPGHGPSCCCTAGIISKRLQELNLCCWLLE